MFLWPSLMQEELDRFRRFANHRRMRKQKDKVLPSGVTPDFAHTFPERFGGRDCLYPVDRNVIKEIMDDMKAEQEALTDWGVSPEFKIRAQAGLDRMGVDKVSLENVWVVFNALLQYV